MFLAVSILRVLVVIYLTWESRVLNNLAYVCGVLGCFFCAGREKPEGNGQVKMGTQDTGIWRRAYRCVFYGYGRQVIVAE
jgi:hypothetical protein